MSKRAHKAALKAHPTVGGIKNLVSKREFINAQNLRMNNIKQYMQGYEQAEKDTIERCIAWLKEHAWFEQNGTRVEVDINKFREAMEEE